MTDTDVALNDPSPEPPSLVDDVWRGPIEERLAAGDFELPMLPQVATEVVRVSCADTGTATRLTELIQQDPALAAHVLRIANSPAYMPRTAILSLEKAIVRLGSVALGEIALAASLQSGVFYVDGHETALQRLWEHAIASGGYAREVARLKGIDAENAFLCGLLHGIGKPAVLQLVADVETDRSERVSSDTLRALMDEFHVRIGGSLAERWELPPEVCSALRSYGDVGCVEGVAVEAIVTAVASVFATHLLEPESLDQETLLAHPACTSLALSPEDIEVLLSRGEGVSVLVDSMTE